MSQVSKVTVKLAGTIMLGFGIGAAILAAWIVERHFALHKTGDTVKLAFIILLVIVSAFCSLVGYRLLFNRPTRHGSTLSPLSWKALAGFFWILGLGITVFSLVRGEYQALVPIACLGALGYGCLLAARGASIKSLPPTIFPPGTSLVAIEGFLPTGFECGIEILNDNLTPMEFVVSMLVDKLGMTEADAIRVMLDIHEKGGVLLATSTQEEAVRIADSITAEARGKNHPLVCRAVSVALLSSSSH